MSFQVVYSQDCDDGDNTASETSPQYLAALNSAREHHKQNSHLQSGAASGALLQEPTRMSKSLIWELQQNYYEQQGSDAWDSATVPSFVTSNSFAAHCFAQQVCAFARDELARGSLDSTEPVYILELGCGSGQFGFLFLKHMKDLWPTSPSAPPYMLVMTDFTQKNLDFCKNHSAMQQFLEAGVVDFALFDAEKQLEVQLQTSQRQLSATHKPLNPVVVLGNYVFDTLSHDAFRWQDGTLFEAQLEVRSASASEPDMKDPTLLDRVRVQWKYAELSASDMSTYYDDPALNATLAWYKANMATALASDSSPAHAFISTGSDYPSGGVSLDHILKTDAVRTFLLPVGGFRCLRNVRTWARRMMVAVSDKGHSHPCQFYGGTDVQGDPRIAVHGSFSVMVNFHSMEPFAEALGGFSLRSGDLSASLKVACVVLSEGKVSNTDFPATTACFRRHMDTFGPGDFYHTQAGLRTLTDTEISVPQVVCLLKLSHYDAQLFVKFREVLGRAGEEREDVRVDVVRAMERCWENHYRVSSRTDVCFEFGLVAMSLGLHEAASEYFQESLWQYGRNALTQFNIGLAYYHCGRLEDSLMCFTTSFALDPEHGPTHEWMQRVQEDLDLISSGHADIQQQIASFLA